MEKIKTYEQFNEEINLKKGLAGLALGASLLGGQSCIKTDSMHSLINGKLLYAGVIIEMAGTVIYL